MARGKNILGHDASYPKDIPELLINHMLPGDIIVDPFLASGTTCMAANEHNSGSIGIEKSGDYYELCKKMIEQTRYDQLFLTI